ncbi:MAG: hypothetical protein L0229_16390 [Blastocatellia bacterium]|nr:hypothetical protein [Blastocatellia bacterium]
MKSVLHKASRIDILDEPFPHIVIRNALEGDLYERLARAWPGAEIILDGREPLSNRNYRYCARDVLSDERISPLWRDFCTYHTSRDFYLEVISLFGDRIASLHTSMEARLGKRLEDLSTSVRFKEEFRDIALECQFTYTAPVTAASRSVGPHIDREVALYAGMLYFRLDEDDSTGGDLELHSFTGTPAFFKESRFAPDSRVKLEKVIEYRKNTLVFFLHSVASVHGVSLRSATVYPRLNVNFVGEFQTAIFDVSRYQTIEQETL